MAFPLQTLSFTTSSVSSGTSTSLNKALMGNNIDIVKVSVTPSNISGGQLTTVGIYKHNTFSASDLVYSTTAFSGTLIDPIETDGVTSAERTEGFVAKYEDLDVAKQLHIKITNSGTLSRTFAVIITYILHDNLGITDLRSLGARGNGSDDDTTAFRAAVLASRDSNAAGIVYCGPGDYLITDEITLPQTGMQIVGSGRLTTTIRFNPTANATCFNILDATPQIILGGKISGFKFYSDDTTYEKRAISINDVSNYVVEDIYITGADSKGSASYWGGGSGSGTSIGIEIRGREAITVRNCYIIADRPISFETNPHAPDFVLVPLDHIHLQDLDLIPYFSPCIGVVAKTFIQSLTIDGYQAWVGGTYGFLWDNAGAPSGQVPREIVIRNARWEEPGVGQMIHIRMATGSFMNQLVIENCNNGFGDGLDFRGVSSAIISGFRHDGSGVALNADSSCTNFEFINCQWDVGTFTTTGFTGQYDADPPGTYHAVTFQNSWVNYGSGFNNVVYWKDNRGVVHVNGAMKSGSVGSAAFTLPARFRPANIMRGVVSTLNGGGTELNGTVQFETAGTVVPKSNCDNTFVYINCSFPSI